MKLFFISLGCDKNLVDSEKMLGDLSGSGYTITDDEDEAEVVIINTCCFIGDAKKESVEAILEMSERRKSGQLKALIVTGCLAQRYKQEIVDEIPEVDAVIGTTATDRLISVLTEIIDGTYSDKESEDRVVLEDIDAAAASAEGRLLTTGGHIAYLKIAEGCNKCCTYCIIPSLRGHYRSVPMPDLLKEAQDLAAQGVQELILVAQETTLYGTDLYGEKKLPELLTKLSWITDLKWIRILYCYPEEITPELVQVMKENPKVLHYIDMPIQHASDDVLKRMGRRTNRKELEANIKLLRTEIPDICIRTTLISGFPGETEKDHEILKSFVKRMKFDRLGVFPYSKEEGTPAAKMKPQIKAAVKKSRRNEIMMIQQEIAFRKAARMKGKILTAIIEGKLVDDNAYTARTYMDAPGVDGMLFIETDREFMSGDFVNVKITGSSGYDLTGIPVEVEE